MPRKTKSREIERTLYRAVEKAQQQETPFSDIDANAEKLFYTIGPTAAHEYLNIKSKLADLKLKYLDLELKKSNAKSLRFFAISWTAVVCVILIVAGGLKAGGIDFLSDNLLLALIGGTTANVLGLYAIVIRNLFPHKKTDS